MDDVYVPWTKDWIIILLIIVFFKFSSMIFVWLVLVPQTCDSHKEDMILGLLKWWWAILIVLLPPMSYQSTVFSCLAKPLWLVVCCYMCVFPCMQDTLDIYVYSLAALSFSCLQECMTKQIFSFGVLCMNNMFKLLNWFPNVVPILAKILCYCFFVPSSVSVYQRKYILANM